VRIGLLSDIHGNRHALEAVPVDAAALRIDAWWVLGDLAAIGPDPVGAVEVVVNLPHAQFVRGNTDRYVLTDDRPPPHPEEVAEKPELFPLFAAPAPAN
jgi:predicted phosphodiesterase